MKYMLIIGLLVSTLALRTVSMALDEAEKLAKHPNALEMIRRLKTQWVLSAAALGRLVIPQVPAAQGAAFDSPHWEKALVLKDFRLPSNWNWGTPTPPKAPTEVSALQDGTNLYFRYTAAATAAGVNSMPKGSADTWPNGDHGEIYLQNKSGNYLFAFDGNSNAYDALNFDKRWTSDWRLQARKTDKGWEALAVIPLADLKFKPGDKDAALSLFILRHYDAGGVQEDSTLNGGILGQRAQYPIVME